MGRTFWETRRFTRKDFGVNDKVCYILDVKDDLFCEEVLVPVLKWLQHNNTPGADNW